MRRLSLVVAALLAGCGQSSSLTIEVLHPTTFMPMNADGNLAVSILDADGKAVSQSAVALKNLSRQRLADGLSLATGKPYVLRLVADGLKGSPCVTGRAVGQAAFTYQDGGTQRVYLDCADASSPAASMLTSRIYHTATYLPALSQVVIVGGAKVDGPADVLTATAHATVESYSLADGKFYKLDKPLEPGRVWHQSVAAGADQVVTFGGMKRNETNSTLVALSEVTRLAQPTPLTGQVQLQGAEAMHRTRGLHALAPLGDGKVLVVGGALSVIAGLVAIPVLAGAAAEVYDLKTGKRVSASPVAGIPRVNPAAAPFGPNRVLVAGGWSEKAATQVELFCGEGAGGCSCIPPCFASGPLLPGERLNLTATSVPCPTGGSGAVYLVGGHHRETGKDTSHAEIFCVATAVPTTLTPYGSLLTARSGHTTTLVRGRDGQQRLLVAGGSSFAASGSTMLNDAELVPVTCDCSKPRASTRVALQTKRAGHSATLLPDGTVLLAGGYSEQSVERFNPDL